jgi:glyceraldehyde 3-phosphate dehydrogenase
MVHLSNGAKGVIISAPSSDKDIPTFVYGVNTDKLTADMKIISGASCTTNCLAPVCKVLNDEYGIKGGFMTTVHAYTNDQTILDLAKGNLRRGRAAAANIVPTTTGAAKAINLVIPELKGRLMGGAVRVPVTDGSLVDLSLLLNKDVTADEVNAAMKKASEGALKGVLGYNEDQIVSSDILGNTNGSIFDSTQTMIYKDPEGTQYVKVVSWYDNEYSFTCQYIRLARAYAKILGC